MSVSPGTRKRPNAVMTFHTAWGEVLVNYEVLE